MPGGGTLALPFLLLRLRAGLGGLSPSLPLPRVTDFPGAPERGTCPCLPPVSQPVPRAADRHEVPRRGRRRVLLGVSASAMPGREAA